MDYKEIKTTVAVDRLFLSADNPRHEEVDDEKEAIEKLCQSEHIEELARDIVMHGTSPAERLIVFPADDKITPESISAQTAFVVAEGNRRLCALKLLHDPDLAPPTIRDVIRNLADGRRIVDEVDVVIMFDADRRQHWMRRIHDGVQGGKGRKPWNAEQKTRFSGSRRNIVAQQLFDYAQKHGLMTEDQRRGNFSHMARLVGNTLVSESLGLDLAAGAEDLRRNRPRNEFDLLLKAVIEEAIVKSLGSQASKARIDRFARDLLRIPEVTANRVDPEPLENLPVPVADEETNPDADRDGNQDNSDDPSNQLNDRIKPKSAKYIVTDKEISDGFAELQHDKMVSLYGSICRINCEAHTPLIAVGVWSFFETLAKTMGGEEKPFKDYFNKGKHGKLAALGIGPSHDVSAITEALSRIATYGNITKHSAVSAFFDYRQVINDMKTLRPLIVACINELKTNG